MQLELWTDGACSGNPGPGGWAAILVARRADGTIIKHVELSGGEQQTTNNRMELQAVIEGLQALQRASAVTVHIDSSYVMDAVTKRWCDNWKARGWKTATKQPVKNRELWEALLALLDGTHRPLAQGQGPRRRRAERALRRAGRGRVSRCAVSSGRIRSVLEGEAIAVTMNPVQELSPIDVFGRYVTKHVNPSATAAVLSS